MASQRGSLNNRKVVINNMEWSAVLSWELLREVCLPRFRTVNKYLMAGHAEAGSDPFTLFVLQDDAKFGIRTERFATLQWEHSAHIANCSSSL